MGIKAELIYYSKECYNSKFVSAYDGNLSARNKKGSIISTSSNTCKGRIKTSDLVKTDKNGKRIEGRKKVSTELKLHLYIYSKRKDINAVIHTHPVFASVFAVTGKALDKAYLPEVFLKFGKIPLAKYAAPSTDEVPLSIENFVMKYNAILLANHGLVTFGRTLEEAYYLTEKAEQYSQICFYASILGGAKELTLSQRKQLEMIQKSGVYK
ncbi:MAG: class II aldolase/adducin family protein [Ignavibacteria bacterium]|nr:class II aldolase/adducin family protein [Ignavibacteria bacterium]MCC7159022.1 class II aldolase/adducin family protein [Ignavibacteria bacterium]